MENTNSSVKLAIIDIDGMFYHAATETIEESIQKFKDKFNNLLEQTQATHYVGFYSNGHYFRHNIDPEYKAPRGKYDPPKWLKALKNWAITEYGFQYMDLCEADDLSAYWMNKNILYNKDYIDIQFCEGRESFKCPDELLDHIMVGPVSIRIPEQWISFNKVLCTPDKDLLQSIPGKHFNYTYKLKDDIKVLVKEDVMYQIQDEDVIKGWWVETSENEATSFKAMQLVVGDSGDNIKALVGKGIKYFEKIAPNIQNFEDILYEYTSLYGLSKGIYEFQKNYRLLHMLENDEDFMREVGKVPNFPIITEVKKETNNIEF